MESSGDQVVGIVLNGVWDPVSIGIPCQMHIEIVAYIGKNNTKTTDIFVVYHVEVLCSYAFCVIDFFLPLLVRCGFASKMANTDLCFSNAMQFPFWVY